MELYAALCLLLFYVSSSESIKLFCLRKDTKTHTQKNRCVNYLYLLRKQKLQFAFNLLHFYPYMF